VITINNLTRNYGNLTAVNSASFTINKGQIVGLLGHNGAGKTTTLKMLTGYLEPTSGEIQIAGLDIKKDLEKIQNKLGYLSENSPLYPEMTVWQYLEYVATLRGITDTQINDSINHAIKATALEDKAMAVINTLSKGYRQRVGVAQAIIHTPEILILDEPTSGLDPTQILAMRNLIKELAKSSTVILSTHIMQEVEAICDRVIIVKNGQIALDSNLDELRKGKGIYLSVNCDKSDLTSIANSITGIKEIKTTGQDGKINHYHISLNPQIKVEQTIPQLANNICNKGLELHNLRADDRNLETIFKEVNSTTNGENYV
jgi:ABC-2 type transport system ATP-binding protein